MAEYYLVKKWECETCNRTGRVQNWMWRQYWEENEGKRMSAEDDIKWFNNNFGIGALSYSQLPSEEDACPECEGDITLFEEVTLKDALVAIGVVSA